ncbi:MAG: hypothetical protein EKK55_20110 [Rhodocyclaceae bacterium]|nr:MAG: hypothetical protein EKK55_20110 [Rhodocyclaceae bacterium]
MSPARTPRSHTDAVNAAVAQVLREHRDDTGYSYAQLAAAVGRSKALVEDWASGAKCAPALLLVHPLVPAALRDRLRALSTPSDAPVPLERTSSLLVGAAARAIGALAAGLADGVMTAEERTACAPMVREVRDYCDKWLRRHGGTLEG